MFFLKLIEEKKDIEKKRSNSMFFITGMSTFTWILLPMWGYT